MVSCLPLRKLRYRQGGKNFPRREQYKSYALGFFHHPSSDSTRASPPSPAFSGQLPVELWLEIIHHVSDARDLAQLIRVNHSFYVATEPILYHNVKLESDNAIVMFAQSLSWAPHRSQIIRGLTVSTLVTIPHSLGTRLEPLPHWGMKGCKAVLRTNYPALRTFTSNLPASLVISFLWRHTHIEELHLVGHPALHSHTWPPEAVTSPALELRSLQNLTCPPRFLHGALEIPPSLTRLSLIPFDNNMFFSSSYPSFRSQLVSLRVHLSRFSRRPPAFRPITLDDVCERFPNLKYLQVDMNHGSDVQELRMNMLFNWTAKRDPHRHVTAAHRLTVAWIYPYPYHRDVDLVRAAMWHQALKEIALEVLLEWEHLVERIVFRHTIIPYVSVALNEYRSGLVFRQERGMTDDHWSTI